VGIIAQHPLGLAICTRAEHLRRALERGAALEPLRHLEHLRHLPPMRIEGLSARPGS
jgi:hypothetical protein